MLASLQTSIRQLGNGFDYDQTFAPVAKMTTTQTILSLVASLSWTLHPTDVKFVFLHGDLNVVVCIKLPNGMPTRSLICKLNALKFRTFWSKLVFSIHIFLI